MAMPEAAVDEDGGFVFGEDDVGADVADAGFYHGGTENTECGTRGFGGRRTRTRTSTRTRRIVNGNADVEAEAVAHAVEEFADDEFGAGVLAANAAHVPGAALFAQAVAHGKRLTQRRKGTKARNRKA